ncbi:MAG: sugar transferase [Flavobacterium sp.]|jgi:lipopolysaccharide/colanic/teichoic acid biosynthesis glycosyltransferase|nr:sugar transferase [Flavobacterium sp.]
MSKRLFDLFFAIFGLIVTLPIIALLYSIATIDTKQNGIFSQTRIGQLGLPFTIYKIRTFGFSNEYPISKVGAFLRNSKLDELPQLWNIFIGNMSFVGPRPDIAGYYDKLEGESRKILQLKPGLTSLASIKYAKEESLLEKQDDALFYNDTIIFPDKVKINLDYFYNNSILGDLKIIWKTIFR